MAKIAALSLSTALSRPSPVGESGAVVGHAGSPRSPLGAVACINDSDGGGPAVDRRPGQGVSDSGGRCDRCVAHSGPNSPGVAC